MEQIILQETVAHTSSKVFENFDKVIMAIPTLRFV
jgi:hypothetical protein